jgi:hypothetical protein
LRLFDCSGILRFRDLRASLSRRHMSKLMGLRLVAIMLVLAVTASGQTRGSIYGGFSLLPVIIGPVSIRPVAASNYAMPGPSQGTGTCDMRRHIVFCPDPGAGGSYLGGIAAISANDMWVIGSLIGETGPLIRLSSTGTELGGTMCQAQVLAHMGAACLG